jgi:cell fate regulator YaaT (PSP1 superfamily)
VRDESKILGGIGSCGRTLCCSTWIEEFRPVSIKMAKQQKLSLDPQKISGICGRLKCCLAYEAEGDAAQCANREDGNDNNKRGLSGCFDSCSRPKPYDAPL